MISMKDGGFAQHPAEAGVLCEKGSTVNEATTSVWQSHGVEAVGGELLTAGVEGVIT